MGAYRDLVAADAWSLPGVRDARTCAVMEELKNTSALPLPAARGVRDVVGARHPPSGAPRRGDAFGYVVRHSPVID
jgi:hypothetical protein